MKSTLLIAVFMIATLSSFGSYFSGVIVAKLPFTPFSLLTNLTHRGAIILFTFNPSTDVSSSVFTRLLIGILGEDLSDCAYIFIYVQMAYIWRTNVQKYFGKFTY